MDEFEQGQVREQIDRDAAIGQHLRRAALRRRNPRPGICMDCEEPIETARRKVLANDVAECAACARMNEIKGAACRKKIT